MNNKKSVIRNFLFVVILLVVVLVVVFSLNDLETIVHELQKMNFKYVIISGLITILYFITWGLSLFCISTRFESKMNNFDLFLVSSCDLFFNGITPFSTGGQPFQVYVMSRGKMKASDATCAVMGKMIVYQVAIVIVSSIALAITYNRVVSLTSNFIILVLIGYFMNLFILVLLLLVSTCKWARNLVLGLFNLIGKIKFLNKFMTEKKNAFSNYVTEFQLSFKDLIKHPWRLLGSLIFQILNLIVMFMIPYFLIKGLSLDGFEANIKTVIYVISLSALNSAFMCWLPTPGAAGGAEFGLQTLLLTVNGVTSSAAVVVMLIWRLFTYYLTLLYGFIMFIILDQRLRKIEHNYEKDIVVD